MTEILFYHLTESRLDDALPGLVERSLDRDWRVVVQASHQETCARLDEHFWTFRDDSFVPHAIATQSENDAKQPVLLTTASDNPNGAHVRFLVDRAEPSSTDGYERIVIMFDGHDMEAVSSARENWKQLKAKNHKLTYWQQEDGRWVKKAES
ncbi:MAG: DNA polymerase III subunit chi [Pseudomonadota bacterium]